MNILSSTLSEGGVGYTVANENFFRLDAFVQFSVKDRTLTAPPGSPTEGDRYLVKATGTSAWAGHDGAVAIWHNSAWIFFTPQEGWQMWVDNEDVLLVYNGTIWVDNASSLVDNTGRVLRSELTIGSSITAISDTAYFVYLGRLQRTATFNYVRWANKTGGTGAQTAECGLFSSLGPPARAGLSMTKIVATGTLDAQTATGVSKNTSAFAQSVVAGTYLWAGVRMNMATTQPAMVGLACDVQQGRVQTTVAAGALTAAGPWSGSIPSDTGAGGTIAPALEITLD